MRWHHTLRLKLRSLLRRGRVEDELQRELQFYLDQQIEENRATGMSEEDARFAARRAVGSLAHVQEQCRDARGLSLVDDLRRDVAYAFGSFARNRAFTAVAVLTLALGIGSTTAMFSVVSGVLLQPLPYPEAARIVQIVENVPAEESFSGRAVRRSSMNQQEFDWWRTQTATLSHMAVTMQETRTVTTANGTERLGGARVSPALFPMRGMQPILGRWLRADEERPDANVVVLSEATWRRYYGGRYDVVGRALTLDGQPHTIVGVMPERFGGQAFWTPFAVEPPQPGRVTIIAVTSRLQDGVTLEEAVAEANALGHRLRGTTGDPGAPPRFDVVREQDQLVAAVRPALRILIAAVTIVMLIVCANVANLLAARGTGRHREIAIRRALGATRARVFRQLLTESVVLSLAGGVAGAALAYTGVFLVRAWGTIDIPARFRFSLGRLGPTILPRVDEIAVDTSTLAFALGISALASLLFGIAPAHRLARIAGLPAGAGRRDTLTGATLRPLGGAGVSMPGRRTGQLLAGVQLALATTLLVAAGLLVHSFVNLSSVRLGFDLDTQVFQLVSPGEYPPSRKIALAYEVERRLRDHPAVTAAGFTNMAQPLEADDDGTTMVPPGWPADRANPGDDRSERRDGSTHFLRALGVRLVEGRWLDERDVSAQRRVMLVNRAWVRRFSPDRSPLGTYALGLCRVADSRCADTPYQIVGVVDDIRLRMEGGPGGLPVPELPKAVFMELRQGLPPPEVMDRPGRMDMMGAGSSGGPEGLAFAVRTAGDPVTLAELRRLVSEVNPRLAVDDLTTMGEVLSAITARPRFYAAVLTIFGAMAAFIAAIGIYGVLALSVSRRTQEFGVRLTVGASPGQILRLALGQGVVLVALGVTIGLGMALGLTRYLTGMLYGLTPLDRQTYAAVAVAFTIVALLAAYVPARRATKVDPLVALRFE